MSTMSIPGLAPGGTLILSVGGDLVRKNRAFRYYLYNNVTSVQ